MKFYIYLMLLLITITSSSCSIAHKNTPNSHRTYSKCTDPNKCGDLIYNIISNNWFYTPDNKKELKAVIKIHLNSSGFIKDMQLVKSSNDSKFDQGAIDAINYSAPFSEIASFPPDVFYKYFGTITITFSPN
jgi:colicin import membrane protein